MMTMNRRTGWLGAAVISLALLAAAAPALAQEISPDQLALARKYVDLTDKVDVYGTTIADVAAGSLATVLRQNPQIGQQATEAVTAVVTEYKGKRADLMDEIARIYAQEFTADELQQFVTFYSSPAGQKLATRNYAINTSLQKVVSLYHNNLQIEFYAKVRSALKAKGLL